MNYSLSAEWGNITSGIDAPFALPQVDITLLSQSVQLCLEQSISNRSSNVRLTPNGILIPPFQAGSENLPEAPLSLRIAGTYYSIQEGTTELCPTLTINGEEQAVKIKVINDNGQLSMHLLESVTFTSTVSIPADGFSKDGTGSSPGYYLSCVSPSNIVCYNGNCDDVCHDLSNEEACTGGEMIMLNAFLTSYDAFVTSVSLDDLSYPLRLNTVQFCNGVQRILLDDNLNILGNVAYKIISQQWVADKENAIILLDGGQISTGNIEDLFDAIPGNDDLSIMVEDESPGSPAAYDPIDPITGQDPDNPLMEVTTPISYYLHDHLGNTRMIIRADDPSAMTITYAADYYPYGKILREWSPCEPERFLTTQHERDSESGYDNRGARLYDADVGRFLSVDPLAEDYAAYSGYNYVLGNPIIMIDPDGRSAKWIPSIDDNG
ncbi:MAG: RHS repeat-associated core domain-containing protein, partial [Bacteroidota bacterium]